MDRDSKPSAAGLIGLCLLLAVLAAGCGGLDIPLFTATAVDNEEFSTGPSPEIIVETFNAAIDVSNGREDEVVVEVTRRTGGINQETAETNLENVEVSITQKDDTILIVAQSSGSFGGNLGASIVIAAPRAARLQLKTSNGHVVSEGMQGTIDAKTTNGRCEIVEARGTIRAHTSNGSIEIEADDADVDAQTTNGRITFQGSLGADKEHRFKTSNGRIELALSEESQFRLTATTSNGRIHCDFPVRAEGRTSRSRLSGSVGENPSTSIIAATSNGSIYLHQADAKSAIHSAAADDE